MSPPGDKKGDRSLYTAHIEHPTYSLPCWYCAVCRNAVSTDLLQPFERGLYWGNRARSLFSPVAAAAARSPPEDRSLRSILRLNNIGHAHDLNGSTRVGVTPHVPQGSRTVPMWRRTPVSRPTTEKGGGADKNPRIRRRHGPRNAPKWTYIRSRREHYNR